MSPRDSGWLGDLRRNYAFSPALRDTAQID